MVAPAVNCNGAGPASAASRFRGIKRSSRSGLGGRFASRPGVTGISPCNESVTRFHVDMLDDIAKLPEEMRSAVHRRISLRANHPCLGRREVDKATPAEGISNKSVIKREDEVVKFFSKVRSAGEHGRGRRVLTASRRSEGGPRPLKLSKGVSGVSVSPRRAAGGGAR